MATLTVNNSNMIEFVNILASGENPTLTAQCEQDGQQVIAVDVFGDLAPVLTSSDARKLAKWLNRAADSLDGVKNSGKKNRSRRYYDEADDIENY